MKTLILAAAPVAIACVMALCFAVHHFLFTDGGRHSAPKPPVITERIAELPGVRAFRSAPPHPRAMFGPGIDGPSVPLPPAERRH